MSNRFKAPFGLSFVLLELSAQTACHAAAGEVVAGVVAVVDVGAPGRGWLGAILIGCAGADLEFATKVAAPSVLKLPQYCASLLAPSGPWRRRCARRAR